MRLLYISLTIVLIAIATMSTWLLTKSDAAPGSTVSTGTQTVLVERGALTPTAQLDGFVQRVEGDAPVFVARVQPGSLSRFVGGVAGAVAQLAGGPGPTRCVALHAPGRTGQASVPGSVVRCLLPRGTAAVVGQPGQIEVRFTSRRNVLVLPVEAVAGSVQQGQVTLVAKGGKRSVVDVRLGASDGSNIEILGGLKAGDRVQEPAPDLPGFNTPSSN